AHISRPLRWLSFPIGRTVPSTSSLTRMKTTPASKLLDNSRTAWKTPESQPASCTCRPATIPTATSSPAPPLPTLPLASQEHHHAETLSALSPLASCQCLSLSLARRAEPGDRLGQRLPRCPVCPPTLPAFPTRLRL